MFNRFIKPERRYARRMARIAQWDRPVTGRWRRFRAWSNMLLNDHGIFRLIYLNEHQLSASFIRAAQPSPIDIRRWAAAGVKTVVNLRGGRESGSWQLEKEACAQAGIGLRDFVLRSRGAPDRETLLSSKAFFGSLEGPAVFHCKSGADRAGFMAALYILAHQGGSAAEALQQLSIRYGHFRFAKTGILDHFVETYQRDGEAKGKPFLDWLEKDYDPEALERSFKPGLVSGLLVDTLLRRE